MPTLARVLSCASAVLGLLTIVRSPRGLAGGVVWLPRLCRGGSAPAQAATHDIERFLALMA